MRIDVWYRPTMFQLIRERTVLTIARGAHFSVPCEEIAKSGTERLRAPKSSIILRSFNLVGRVIREEIGIEYFRRRAPRRKSQNQGQRLCAPLSSIILGSFHIVGQVIRRRASTTRPERKLHNQGLSDYAHHCLVSFCEVST